MNAFILEDGAWDWRRILSYLSIEVCECIAGIAPPSNFGIPNTVVWLSSHEGTFLVRSAYNYISCDCDLPTNSLFRLIWKWKGMERIKVFLW